MRLHYFQHVPFEGLAGIERWAVKEGLQISRTRFFEDDPLPKLEDIDLLVIVGGPMSVNDERDYPWLADEKHFIDRAIRAGKPVLGICLGAQMIASVLGAKVYRNKEKEIGWFPVELTKAGRESCLRVIGKRRTVFHWHGETFDLPSGARHLAKSAVCRNQAFQYGDSVIGLQFHLEMTPQSLKAIIRHCRKEILPARFIQSIPQMKKAPLNHMRDLHVDLADFLTSWVAKIPPTSC